MATNCERPTFTKEEMIDLLRRCIKFQKDTVWEVGLPYAALLRASIVMV